MRKYAKTVTSGLADQARGKDAWVQTGFAIAVIDDDDSFRVALVESLCSFGFETSGYSSARDFIARNGQRLYRVIVTDVHMPGMSGLDLIRHLSASGSKIPVVLITAHCEAGLEARAAAAGAAGSLEKPFEINDLIKCIEGAVGPSADQA
jgi:FixJ family two-component response regulator